MCYTCSGLGMEEGCKTQVKAAHKTDLLMAQIPQLQSKSHINRDSGFLSWIYQCALMIF